MRTTGVLAHHARLLSLAGSRAPYLLKGRDDLRLDERVMQLLRSTNLLLCADRTARERCLDAAMFYARPNTRLCCMCMPASL